MIKVKRMPISEMDEEMRAAMEKACSWVGENAIVAGRVGSDGRQKTVLLPCFI